MMTETELRPRTACRVAGAEAETGLELNLAGQVLAKFTSDLEAELELSDLAIKTGQAAVAQQSQMIAELTAELKELAAVREAELKEREASEEKRRQDRAQWESESGLHIYGVGGIILVVAVLAMALVGVLWRIGLLK